METTPVDINDMDRLREELRRLVYYAHRFGIPESKMAQKIEEKINLIKGPDATEENYRQAVEKLRLLIGGAMQEYRMYHPEK